MQPFANIQNLVDSDWVSRARETDKASWSPGWREAVWWLGLPVILTVTILTFAIGYPEFYRQHLLPEGYGVLELLHFAWPLMAAVICGWLFFRPSVRQNTTMRVMTGVFAIACLYIGGEEQSWGQHFFGWSTPDYWSSINRQQETNLHNTLGIFNHTPQKILELSILIGGIILPLWNRFIRPLENGFLRLYVPPLALFPVALISVCWKVMYWIQKTGPSYRFMDRPSEALETFYYLFILFYVIVYARRILALDKTMQ